MVRTRIARGALFALVLIALAWGCDRPSDYGLPAAAREAVLQQAGEVYAAQALRLSTYDQEPDLRIARAWPGKEGAYSTQVSGRPEVWCVDLAIKSIRDGKPIRESAVWIVVRNPEQTEWGAGLLMAMSSLWPYEACGETPWATPTGEK